MIVAERQPSKYQPGVREAMRGMGEREVVSIEKFLANLGIRGLYELPNEHWRDDALCQEIDADVFYSDHPGSTTEAKRICQACIVRTQCLQYAVTAGERDGVWGGTTETFRRKLIRERRNGR